MLYQRHKVRFRPTCISRYSVQYSHGYFFVVFVLCLKGVSVYPFMERTAKVGAVGMVVVLAIEPEMRSTDIARGIHGCWSSISRRRYLWQCGCTWLNGRCYSKAVLEFVPYKENQNRGENQAFIPIFLHCDYCLLHLLQDGRIFRWSDGLTVSQKASVADWPTGIEIRCLGAIVAHNTTFLVFFP